MRLLNPVIPLVVGVLSLFTDGVQARSQAPNAIRRVSSLEQPTIKASSNRVDHLSHFDITFSIRDKEERIKLELEPNYEILADNAYVQYLDADGKIHMEEPIPRHRHRVFKGRTLIGRGKGQGMWEPVGWTRIYIKQDGPRPLFEGVFNIRGDNHHVELQSTYLRKKRPQDVDIPRQDNEYMVFYRDSDTLQPAEAPSHPDLKRSLDDPEIEPRWSTGATCGSDGLDFNRDPEHPVLKSFTGEQTSKWAAMPISDLFGFGLSKRQNDISGNNGNMGGINLQNTIGDKSGCPSTMLVALIGVATDCSFWEKFNGKSDVEDAVISMVNSASNVFEDSFNISLGLRNLTITERACTENPSTAAQWNMPCSQGNLTSRLDLFSQWRGQQTDDNAYWTLMSACPTGSEVGLAWLGQLCNSEVGEGSSGTGANVVVSTGGAEWQIFAHESGHTFGAVHDCTSQACSENQQTSSQCCPLSRSTCDARGDYIMNPSTGTDITEFSQCTIGNICSAIGRNSVKSSCLSENRGIVTYTGAQCGNGIVEEGEDCDCGGEENCGNNDCCDASTCKFKNDAVCDDANDNCCISCQYASSDVVCRASRGECDFAETCTGNSSACPTDTYKDDGDDCGDSGSGLKCASGQCTSRDAQCESYMGDVAGTNNTRPCDEGPWPICQMYCRDPDQSSGLQLSCLTNNQNYLDGTSCGNSGQCRNGRCVGSKSWIDEHKNIIIPVAAGVGGLIILAILICIFRRCRRRRYTMKPVPAPTYGAWPRNMPPPPPSQPTPMRRLSRPFRPGYGQVPQGPPPQGPYPTPYGPYPSQGPPRGPMPAPYPGAPEPRYDDGPPPGYVQNVRYA
ncbi:Metallo-peptidase family M12-domain-containing protein [Aspergillus karnatakaensis]|uniref:ADAM family of metalloprotease ADM-B n=1 Tax=Aspergillus karnatakaensis TaxID=1810916 RepID=UPI003CCD4A01